MKLKSQLHLNKLFALSICAGVFYAHTSMAAPSSISGTVKAIEVRTPAFNYGNYSNYIKLDVSGYVRSYKIDPQEAKGKEILAAAIAAKSSGEPMTIRYDSSSCEFPNDHCVVQAVEY